MNHTNTEQLLAPRLCRSGWDSTFDLFKPFYSASSPSDNTQIQLGHNKFMQPWKPSRDALNGANWTQHLMCFQQQIVVWLKVGKKTKNTQQHVCLLSKWKPSWMLFFSWIQLSRLSFFFRFKRQIKKITAKKIRNIYSITIIEQKQKPVCLYLGVILQTKKQTSNLSTIHWCKRRVLTLLWCKELSCNWKLQHSLHGWCH